MSDSNRTQLLKQVLEWTEEQLDITGSGADPQVILAQRGDKSPRPSLPYLVLNFTSFDMPVGTVETQWQSDDTRAFGAHRQAMLEIRGIGPGSDDWLQELAFRTDSFDGDMSIVTLPNAATLDASILVNESWEEQYIKEFLCEYKLRDSETYPTAAQSTVTYVELPDEEVTLTTVIDWES